MRSRSRLRPDERTPYARELEALPHVAAVEARSAGGDREELVALPRDGRDILSDIAPTARRRGWPIEEIQLLRGHLDEVFRAVTTRDHDAGEATGTGAVTHRRRRGPGFVAVTRCV